MSALEAMRQRARYEHARLVLGRVVQTCKEAGVDALPVKGIVTAGLLYVDPVMRPFQDVDLRVRPRDLRRVERAAARAGWATLSRSRAYETLAFDVLGFLVEFESHVGPPGLCGLTVDAMLERAVCMEAGSAAEHLQPEIHDHVLLLCVNAFKDKLVDALPGALGDLELLPGRPGFEARTLATLAKDTGATTILRIVATWLIDNRSATIWRDIRAALEAAPRRRIYTATFAAAAKARPPRRRLLRLIARVGADRQRQRLRALAAMAARGVEDMLAGLPGTNEPAVGSIRPTDASAPPTAASPTARMCSPR